MTNSLDGLLSASDLNCQHEMALAGQAQAEPLLTFDERAALLPGSVIARTG